MNNRIIGNLGLAFIIIFCIGATFSFDKSYGTQIGDRNSKVHTVQIIKMKFEPTAIHVRKGDKIVFRNRDMVTHDVTELSRKAWNSSPIEAGKSWTMVVQQSDHYFCSIHQIMKGQIIVEQ